MYPMYITKINIHICTDIIITQGAIGIHKICHNVKVNFIEPLVKIFLLNIKKNMEAFECFLRGEIFLKLLIES